MARATLNVSKIGHGPIRIKEEVSISAPEQNPYKGERSKIEIRIFQSLPLTVLSPYHKRS